MTPEPHPELHPAEPRRDAVVAMDVSAPIVIVAARNEADRIAATLHALTETFPGARIWLADDASTDGTGEIGLANGAQVVTRRRPHGKGGNVTAAAEAMLSDVREPEIVLLCDGDLGDSARELSALVGAVRSGECDLAIAAFRARIGGGFGLALGLARRAIARRCGFNALAPISGQRALTFDALRAVLPFASGYGMETAMTIDAVRAGYRVAEIELELAHRATGRTLGGFAHRGRQLLDIQRASRARRSDKVNCRRGPSSPG